MARLKIALLNIQEFEIEYSSFDIMNYIIIITKADIKILKIDLQVHVILYK